MDVISKGAMMRFVVIGGDAAGMSAASRAKRHDPSLQVTVFEKGRDVSYSA
jgi:protoporphyrinogen oxidase